MRKRRRWEEKKKKNILGTEGSILIRIFLVSCQERERKKIFLSHAMFHPRQSFMYYNLLPMCCILYAILLWGIYVPILCGSGVGVAQNINT